MSNQDYAKLLKQFPELAILLDTGLKLEGKPVDPNLLAQRHAEYRQQRKLSGKKHPRVIDKSFWHWLIGVVRSNMDKEPLRWGKLFTEANLYICVNALKAYLDIDLSETISDKFMLEILNNMKQIVTDWLADPKDTSKFLKELDFFYNARICKLITDGLIKQDWIDILLEVTFMQKKDSRKRSTEKTYLDMFKIYFDKFWSALSSGLDSGVKFLLKFDNDDLQKIKAAKQELERIEDNYDHVETFEARVDEYGEVVKVIEHKTNLYTKLEDEDSKTNMMASINDDVENFRTKKRKLNTDISSTWRDLNKGLTELMEHRYRMRTAKTLPFITILIGVFLNSLSDNQKKKEQIDGALVANMTERSSAVIESITEDLDDVIEQKGKVLDKLELVEKIKANFTGWHRIEKDCLEFLNKNIKEAQILD